MPSKPSFKKAFITGATSGLGEALSHFLEERQIEVIRTGSHDVDLAHPLQRKTLLTRISSEEPDLIINNAGFGFYGPSLDISIEDQLKIIEVNISALVEISLHSAKTLIQSGKTGTILNISSAGAFFPYPTFNVYCASKRFVNQFSLALDTELRSQGVRVLCACPGQIATNFRTRAAKGHPQKPDKRTMSIDTALTHIWRQIQKNKRLTIFDKKTRAMVYLAKILPASLLEKILMKGIADRI